MANENNRPKAVYQPGELDKTRKNLGDIDSGEIGNLTKLLGGEIGVEKTAAPPQPLPRGMRKSGEPDTSGVIKRRPGASGRRGSGGGIIGGTAVQAKRDSAQEIRAALPVISEKERKKMDVLMMSGDYQIKQNYGIFNFFIFLNKKREENITGRFFSRTLSAYITHMDAYSQSISELLSLAPEPFTTRVMRNSDVKSKLLRMSATWTFAPVRSQYNSISESGRTVTIQSLIPIIRTLYRMLMPVFFLGMARGCGILESVMSDLAIYPDVNKNQVISLIRKAATEWKYFFQYVFRGMYPLLMRICASSYDEYPDFFTNEITGILQFTKLTKYDLLLPEKKRAPNASQMMQKGAAGGGGQENEQEQDGWAQGSDDLAQGIDDWGQNEESDGNVEEEGFSEEEDAAASTGRASSADINKAQKQAQEKLSIVGLKFLNLLFPDNDWLKLSSHPDMYPFFQPIFKFPDGFGFLAPENPVQQVLVFLRVLEDLFRGCRNIQFNFEQNAEFRDDSDNFAVALDEWGVYQDILFGKHYAEFLKDMVSRQTMEETFIHSAIGKRMLFNLMWQTKHYFLPNYTILGVGISSYELTYKPLFLRVAFLRRIFSFLSDRLDIAAKNRDGVSGIQNPWDPYKFEIPNVVSKRLDMINQVQKNPLMSTNAGIIKYTAAVLSAFDWWVNDKKSPAYGNPNAPLYRMDEDGKPAYPPPLRNDQYALFRKRLEQIQGKS